MANAPALLTLHSNDVVFLTWRYEKKIDNCLGFSVKRKDVGSRGDFVPLPAWVGWEGGSNEKWEAKNTDVWPVQKFNWRDFTAKPGSTYQYQIVPMVGQPDKLQAVSDPSLILTSEPVTLTPDAGPEIQAYFNNGILSTQHVAHLLPSTSSGAPSSPKLLEHIRKAGDQLRLSLAGQMIDALKSLLKKAASEGGQCYCALYELDDPELIQLLIASKKYVHIILSSADVNEGPGKSREQLHGAGMDVSDRLLGSGHIGHNKFVVYLDAKGKPSAVLAGSTNWTSTGLCAQSNNSVIVTDPTIAVYYWDYWQRLQDDTKRAQNVPSQLQSDKFRSANNRARAAAGVADLWFSPNTKNKTKPKGVTLTSGTPGDMAEVFTAIEGAQQAILFLEFEPGTPSVLDKIKEVEEGNSALFVRGAATDANAISKFDDQRPITTELYHRSSTGEPDQVLETGVAATEIKDEFGYWKKELLKSSPKAHAIIHDKIVVIDPLSPQCAVITGSHNQGYKASYCNDENLLIFRGNQDLARAYATHVLDVYDHYRWRYWLQKKGDKAWTGLQKTPDWQDGYFQPGNMAYKELAFWFSIPAAQLQKSAAAAAASGRSAPEKPVRKTTGKR